LSGIPFPRSAPVALALRHLAWAMLALVAIGAGAASARPFAPFGQSANQIAVGASLDSQAGTPPAARAAMFNAIDALPTVAARADALGQLSSQNYSALPKLAIQALDARAAMIGTYLADRRSRAIDGPDRADDAGTINMVLLGDVRGARYAAAADRPKTRSDSRSIGFGVDFSPRSDVILGVMVGIDGTDARLDSQRPRINLFNTSIGPYASINNGRVYVDASLTYNYADYKLRRQVGFGSFADRLTAKADGDGWAASGETGYMLKGGRVRIQPFAGLHYRYSEVNGLLETGGAAALRVAPYHGQSLRSSLGARVSTTIEQGRWAIRPSVQADWRYELRGRPDTRIEARPATNDLATFILQPNKLARNVATVAAGITATYGARTSVRIGYNGELASDRRIHALALSISRRF
jgi:outer membrane autotransporter protein